MNERIEDLCGQMLDEKISPQDFNELQSLLEESQKNRQFYYEICEAHALLKDQHEHFQLPKTKDLPSSKFKWKMCFRWK